MQMTYLLNCWFSLKMVLTNIYFPKFNILLFIKPTFKLKSPKTSTTDDISFSNYRRGGGTEVQTPSVEPT